MKQALCHRLHARGFSALGTGSQPVGEDWGYVPSFDHQWSLSVGNPEGLSIVAGLTRRAADAWPRAPRFIPGQLTIVAQSKLGMETALKPCVE